MSLKKSVNYPQAKFLTYLSQVQGRCIKVTDKHDCSLPESYRKTDIIKETIDSGIFIGLRRKYFKLLMINQDHPYCKKIFRSMSEIRREEIRHMVLYKWMVHPFSIARLYLDFFMALLHIVYLLIILPEDLCVVRSVYRRKLAKFGADMIMTIFMIINFFLGYYDPEKVEVIMIPKTVARNYLKTFFIWDLISCFPSYIIYVCLTQNGASYISLTKWLSQLRVVRLVTIEESIELFRLYMNFPSTSEVITKMILRIYCFILCALCVMFFIKQYEYNYTYISKADDLRQSLETTYTTVTMMFGVGQIPVSFSMIDTIGSTIILMGSRILEMWAIAKVYVLWQRYVLTSELEEDLTQQLSGYISYRALPVELRDQVYCYFDFRFQKQVFNDSMILSMFSNNLRQEIPRFQLEPCIQNVEFINVMPEHVLMSVISVIKPKYYLPGDIIFEVNTKGNALFFIMVGTTALFNESGNEICHLEDGSSIGATAAVLEHYHSSTMIAIAPSLIYILQRTDLMRVLEKFPDTRDDIIEITQRRISCGLFD